MNTHLCLVCKWITSTCIAYQNQYFLFLGCLFKVSLLDIGYVHLHVFEILSQAGICLALSGPSILYGKMQPFLNEVELHEHYYIQGPPGCSGDGIQLFAMMGTIHRVLALCVKHDSNLDTLQWVMQKLPYQKKFKEN